MHLLLQYRTSLETNIIRKHNLESDNTNRTPRLKKYLRGQELSMVQSGHKDVSFLLLWLMLLYLLFVCWLVCLLFIFCFLYFLSSFCSFFFLSSALMIRQQIFQALSGKVKECNIWSACIRQPKRILMSSHTIDKASPDVIKMWNMVD